MEQTNLLGTNKATSEYAVIYDADGTLDVFLHKEEPTYRPSREMLIEDADIQIAENGTLHFSGSRVRCDYFYHDDERIYEDLVATGKYILDETKVYQPKMFNRFPIGKPVYRSGWVELKKRVPYRVATSNYRITVVEQEQDDGSGN